MPRTVTVLLLGAAAALPPTRPARVPDQPPCAGARLVPDPERPRQGALFRVRVEGVPAGAELRGEAAGEPLHFAAAGARDGAHEALAAAPIDAGAPLAVTVACAVAGRADTLRASVALAAADYPLERL